MSNHEQLPEGLIIPPKPTEIPEIVDSEAPTIKVAETRFGYDTPASVLPTDALVSQPIPASELYQSLDTVDARENAISQLLANNARERLASAETAAARTMNLFEQSHDDIVKKVGQHEAAAEVTLRNELAKVDREFAIIIEHYERQAQEKRREATSRYEQKCDAIATVNASNEASHRGFMRSELNIGNFATGIRVALDEQEVIRDRSKIAVDQLVAELADKQKERADKNDILDELQDQLTSFNAKQAELIKTETRLTISERAEHNKLLDKALEQEETQVVRDRIYNEPTDEAVKEEKYTKYLQELSERLSSRELESIRYDIQMNSEQKITNEDEIRYRTKIINSLQHEIKELDKRIKMLPGLIVVEKTKCSDAIETIDDLNKASMVLEQTAAKFEVARLHPEISNAELMKLDGESEGMINSREAQQILAALRPALIGGKSLIAALRGEHETALQLANVAHDFDVESAPELTGPTGEAVPAPDVNKLIEAARKASKETRGNASNVFAKVWHKIVDRALRTDGAYQYDVTGSNQLSLTAGNEG